MKIEDVSGGHSGFLDYAYGLGAIRTAFVQLFCQGRSVDFQFSSRSELDSDQFSHFSTYPFWKRKAFDASLLSVPE